LSGRRTPRRLGAALALLLALCGFIAPHGIVNAATAPSLGTAQNFAVLGATVTNTGPTMISGGNLGVSPGLAITGFPPGIVNPPGTIHAGDAVALQAQSDATIAYNNLAGQPCTSDLTGQDLGGLTLIPGVYCFSSSAQLTGTLTLDAQGNAGAVFIFKVGSTLTTASNSAVRVINGGSVCNVYWQIGSSATLGTNTAFAGNVLASASITLNTSAMLSGRAHARTGAVTLDTNTISAGCTMLTATATPTPIPTATPTPIPTATATVPAATQTVIAATQTAPPATQTVIAATQTAPAATQTAPAATQTAIAATQTVIAATQTAPAATQTAPAATQTAIAATQAAPAATRTAITATQMVIAATQTAPAATQMAIAATQTVTAKSTAATTPTTMPRAVSPVRTPVNTSVPYRIPPNGAPSNGIVPYPGQAPIGPVNVALSTPVIVSSIPTPTVVVTATQTPTSVTVVSTAVPTPIATASATTVSTAVPTPIATASATTVSTATPTQIATATVMIPNRLPNTGGGGLATTFTETTDTHRGVDVALWITLTVFLTFMRVCFLRVRRARR